MSEKVVSLNEKIINPILSRKERILTFWGGSASGKTTNILLFMLGQLFGDRSENWNGAIVRRYYPELKKGLWKDAKKYIEDWGKTKSVKFNETNLTMSRGNRCLFFINAENEERLKGLDFNMIFVDEINQLSEETFMEILNRSGRKKGSKTKIFTAFNPISANHWSYKKLVLNPIKDSWNLKLTYHDNIKNLSESYIKMLEDLKETCPRRYQIYTLGNAGVYEGLIYSPDKWDMLDRGLHTGFDCFGLDFGFNHPTVLIGIKRLEDGSFYVHEIYYETETTILDLIEWMKRTNDMYKFTIKNLPIYCDSAEADRIEQMKRSGFNALKANKSIDAGISFCQGCILHLSPFSENLRKEIETYSWAKDENGFTEKPVKIYDDACDAMRYGIFTHFGKRFSNKIEYISGDLYGEYEYE